MGLFAVSWVSWEAKNRFEGGGRRREAEPKKQIVGCQGRVEGQEADGGFCLHKRGVVICISRRHYLCQPSSGKGGRGGREECVVLPESRAPASAEGEGEEVSVSIA
jgi:hypothetical protein